MRDFPEHPVGYRPGERRGAPAAEGRPGEARLRTRRVLALAGSLLVAGAAFASFLSVDGGSELAERLGGLVERSVAAPGGEGPPATATLDSGQVIEGDFEILDYEQVRAGGVEKAMSVAIEKYPHQLRELLEVEGVDPDLRIPHSNGDGWTHPLEKAVRQGTPETLRILLDAGADVNGAGSDGATALHAAAWLGSLDVVEELLRRGADPDALALPRDHAERRKRVEQLGGEWEPVAGAAAIETAAGRGHREIVERLLDAGADPRYALLTAGTSGDVELIDSLLRRGADPRAVTAYGESTLRHAATAGQTAAVDRLLAAGARPCEMALRGAAQNGHDAVLRAFAASGVRFDGPPAYWDPLYAAAHAGHASTVALLLELGARTGAAEGQDRPIDAARAGGHAEVVALLEGR